MEKKISEICEELCLKKIAWDEELIATGVLNSFILMELICRLEKEFQVVFTAEEISELENFSCINNMAALLCVKRKSKDLE